MPTALLPGIGASMRRVRAARAMARSSASASIRLTLTCGAGWTSYWVTTGPALRPTIWAGISKLASFLTMMSSVRRWTLSSPAGLIRSTVASSSSRPGSVYSMRSRVGGESEASVMSSRSRTGRGRSPPAMAVAAPVAVPAPLLARLPPGVRAGAKVADVGTVDGIGTGASSPNRPVCPGTSAGAPATLPPRTRAPPRTLPSVGAPFAASAVRRPAVGRGGVPAAGAGGCPLPRY